MSEYSVPAGWYRLRKGTELIAGDMLRKAKLADGEDSANLVHYHEITPCGNRVMDSFCIRKKRPWWHIPAAWAAVVLAIILLSAIGVGLGAWLVRFVR